MNSPSVPFVTLKTLLPRRSVKKWRFRLRVHKRGLGADDNSEHWLWYKIRDRCRNSRAQIFCVFPPRGRWLIISSQIVQNFLVGLLVQNFLKFLHFVEDFYTFVSKYFQIFTKISPLFHENFSKISPNFAWNFSKFFIIS